MTSFIGDPVKFYSENNVPKEYGLGKRHGQAIIFFLCATIATGAWSQLMITAFSMHERSYNGTYFVRGFKENNMNSFDGSTFNKIFRNFKNDAWDIIITLKIATFLQWTDLLTFPISLIGQRWGAKVLMQIILAISAVVSIASPWITWLGWEAFLVFQVLQKSFSAGVFPALHTFLGRWTPASERAGMTAFVYAGTIIGPFLAQEIHTIINLELGWPASFWINGIQCIVMFIILSMFGVTSPEDCKSMSKEEKYFIMGHTRTSRVEHNSVPWMELLKSRMLYLCVLSQSFSWACMTLLIYFPTYLSSVYVINLSNVPYFSNTYMGCIGLIMCIAFGVSSDFFTNMKLIQTKTARSISNSFGVMVPVIFLCCVTFIPHTFLTIPLFMMSHGCWRAGFSGWLVSYIDLSPKYCGVLMAIGQTLTVITTSSTQMLLSLVTISKLEIPLHDTFDYLQRQENIRWRITYFVICGLAVIVNVLYVKYISTEVQPFNDHEYEKELDNMQKRSAARMKI